MTALPFAARAAWQPRVPLPPNPLQPAPRHPQGMAAWPPAGSAVRVGWELGSSSSAASPGRRPAVKPEAGSRGAGCRRVPEPAGVPSAVGGQTAPALASVSQLRGGRGRVRVCGLFNWLHVPNSYSFSRETCF